jgi:hypothetical protein
MDGGSRGQAALKRLPRGMAGISSVTMVSTDSDRRREGEADTRAERHALLAAVAIIAGFWAVNALSIGTELERQGIVRDGLYPWVLEGSSAVIILLLMPAVFRLARLFPPSIDRWRVALPVHLAGVVAFSAVHIAGMVWLRKLLWPLLFDRTYIFFGDMMRELIYEFRKDALVYVLFVMFFHMVRSLEQHRMEAEAARTDARTTHRITLRCGGRTMQAEASRFRAAKAAGNYVEAFFGSAPWLARTTLSALEEQLAAAGVRAARVHRGWVVNLDEIERIDPTGEGDVTITLKTGETVPGSRRYRDRLP